MQLERARIKNFRSLRDIDVSFGAHTAMIGGNGAGKSSILKAIEKFYSTSKTCEADDFFGRDQGQAIEIELTSISSVIRSWLLSRNACVMANWSLPVSLTGVPRADVTKA